MGEPPQGPPRFAEPGAMVRAADPQHVDLDELAELRGPARQQPGHLEVVDQALVELSQLAVETDEAVTATLDELARERIDRLPVLGPDRAECPDQVADVLLDVDELLALLVDVDLDQLVLLDLAHEKTLAIAEFRAGQELIAQVSHGAPQRPVEADDLDPPPHRPEGRAELFQLCSRLHQSVLRLVEP